MSNTGIWDLSVLYSGPQDPKIESDMLASECRVTAFCDKWSARSDYLEDPHILRSALDDYESLQRDGGTADNAWYYVTLACALDAGNQALKALQSAINARMTVMSKRVQFFSLRIGKISAQTQQVLLADTDLAPYHTWLERRFAAAAHDLTQEVEAAVMDILPLATTSWRRTTDEILANAQTRMFLDGVWTKVPFNELTSYLTTADADLAWRANQAYARIAQRHATVAEHEINALITANTRMSRLRGFPRVDAPSFLRNDLSATTVDSLLETVESRYSTAHRIYELKARLFGRTSLHYYERARPFGELPSGYSFDQAAALVRKVYARLHPDFAELFDQALANGRIDHVTRKGKRGGAACWHNLIDQPIFELLNFTGELSDVKTLAHESGHMTNNLYMQSGGRCNSLSFGTTTAMAEVASTFFEKYTLDAAVEDLDDDETKLAIMLASLDSDVSKIYRQTAATRFEQALYAEIDSKGYLSKQQIGKLFTHHMAAYLGPAVVLDCGASVGWVHWSHFRTGFYNYSYTFAQLVANALQDRVDADPRYISEFCRFLETGKSQRTATLLHSLGLNPDDGSIWKPGLDRVDQQTDAAFALAVKLGKI